LLLGEGNLFRLLLSHFLLEREKERGKPNVAFMHAVFFFGV
jgi:hypothetical protein